MQLRDRGLLSLDDPLIKYIPELAAIHDPYGPISSITIRHAMSHSAGFRDPTWPWRPDGKEEDPAWAPFEPTQFSQIVAMLPYTAIAFPPGSRFSYSNLGVVFLGEIIERLSGDPYAVYMEKNILRPLGMSRSYYDRSPYHLLPYRSHSWDLIKGKLTEDPFDFSTGITRSNGGLNAPLGDMLKYLNFLLGETATAPGAPAAPPANPRYHLPPTPSPSSSAAPSKKCGAPSSPSPPTTTSSPVPAPTTKSPPASSSTPTAASISSAMPAGKTAFAATSTSTPPPAPPTSSPTTQTPKIPQTPAKIPRTPKTPAPSTSSCATI